MPNSYLLVLLALAVAVVGSGLVLRARDASAVAKRLRLEIGPIRHSALAPELVARVDAFLPVFAEVDPTTRDKWLEDFQRDQNPEHEIATWEHIASALTEFAANKELGLATKREAFSLLLARSMSSSDAVLASTSLKELSREQAQRLLSLYYLSPKPITVQAPN